MYGLSSVTLEKFFLGPLPRFLSLSSAGRTDKHPAVNGCVLNSHVHSAQNGVNSDVIDLTEDDAEVPVVPAKRDKTLNSLVQNNKNRKRPAQKNNSSEIPADTVVPKKRIKASKSLDQPHENRVSTATVVEKKLAESSSHATQKQKRDPGISVVPKKRTKPSNSSVPKCNVGVTALETYDRTSHGSIQSDDFEIPTVTVDPRTGMVTARHCGQKDPKVLSGQLMYISSLSSLILSARCSKSSFRDTLWQVLCWAEVARGVEV